MDDHESERISERNAVAVYDVGGCVKSWGLRGLLGGSLIGFALGVFFVALPHTENILTFGVAGTLIVGAVEGAIIAGALAACAAALYGKGVLRGRAASRTRSARRPIPGAGKLEGDISSSDWPTEWPHPSSVAAHPLPEDANTVEHSLQNARMQLNTIDAWENGSSGP
jgi:hypothetical protein